jgi:hypothetical protein
MPKCDATPAMMSVGQKNALVAGPQQPKELQQRVKAPGFSEAEG